MSLLCRSNDLKVTFSVKKWLFFPSSFTKYLHLDISCASTQKGWFFPALPWANVSSRAHAHIIFPSFGIKGRSPPLPTMEKSPTSPQPPFTPAPAGATADISREFCGHACMMLALSKQAKPPELSRAEFGFRSKNLHIYKASNRPPRSAFSPIPLSYSRALRGRPRGRFMGSLTNL